MGEINSKFLNIIAEKERRMELEAGLEENREKQIVEEEERRRKYELEEQRRDEERSNELRVNSMMVSMLQQIMSFASAVPTRHPPSYYPEFSSPPAMDSSTTTRCPLSYYAEFTQNPPSQDFPPYDRPNCLYEFDNQ